MKTADPSARRCGNSLGMTAESLESHNPTLFVRCNDQKGWGNLIQPTAANLLASIFGEFEYGCIE
jgi:hypothetical protein